MATHHRSPNIATVTISMPPELAAAVDRRTRDLHFLSRSSYVCGVLRAHVIAQEQKPRIPPAITPTTPQAVPP